MKEGPTYVMYVCMYIVRNLGHHSWPVRGKGGNGMHVDSFADSPPGASLSSSQGKIDLIFPLGRKRVENGMRF